MKSLIAYSARHLKCILPLLLVSSLAACSQPSMTREQSYALKTKEFSGVKPAEAIKQAEMVMRLMDGNDVRFSYSKDAFYAQRPFFVFAVITAVSGTYQFQVSAEETPRGSRVAMDVFVSSSSTSASIIPVGGSYIATPMTTVGANGQPIDLEGTYKLFFTRLGHLLNTGEPWMTCPEAQKLFKGVLGGTQPLCVSAADNSPGQGT